MTGVLHGTPRSPALRPPRTSCVCLSNGTRVVKPGLPGPARADQSQFVLL